MPNFFEVHTLSKNVQFSLQKVFPKIKFVANSFPDYMTSSTTLLPIKTASNIYLPSTKKYDKGDSTIKNKAQSSKNLDQKPIES